MKITIGRLSGPVTDLEISSTFEPSDLDIIKDTIAMVNKATNEKEQFYVIVDDGDTIVPTLKE